MTEKNVLDNEGSMFNIACFILFTLPILLLFWGVLSLVEMISPLDVRDNVGVVLFLIVMGISTYPLMSIAKTDQKDEKAKSYLFPLMGAGLVVAGVDLVLLYLLGAHVELVWGLTFPLLQVPLGLLLLWRRNMINLVYLILLTLPIIGILFGG